MKSKADVLILIDIQRGFREPIWGPRNNPAFEVNVEVLLATWRAACRPVIHVRHDSIVAGAPLAPSRPGNAFEPFVQPLKDEPVVSKSVNSAFIGTDLARRLGDPVRSRLTFVGLTTDHCVSTSVRMAANLGFECVVVSDATATFMRLGECGARYDADLVHDISLASLREEFAHVVTTKRLLAGLPPAGVPVQCAGMLGVSDP